MTSSRLSRLEAPKILVVRNDGLGDFLLTLPLVAALRQQLPGARILALIGRNLAALVPLLPDLEGAVLDEGVLLKRHRGLFSKAERKQKRAALLDEIREHDFDLAVLPYAEGASAALIHRAGIPLRAGSLRRPYFWRFNLFNATARKNSGKPEYELNLTYLETLGLSGGFAAPAVSLPGGAGAPPFKDAVRAPGQGYGARPYVVIHPFKRNATALSWPMAQFKRLAERFASWGFQVVVVGDAADEAVLRSVFTEGSQLRIVTGTALPELAGIVAGARFFVGNSSGPLHLAGLLGTPHVGLYPQNRVSAPARWRTLPVPGAPPDPAAYLLSPHFPKNCVRCEMERCPYFNCVSAISVEQVCEAARAWGMEPTAVERNAAGG